MALRDLVRQGVTLVAIPVGIGITLTPFGGRSVGETASGGPDTPLHAAGYAFSIWGLIFTWQLVYVVWQALPAQRERPVLRRTGWWTALNGIGNGAWWLSIVAGQYALAAVLIFVLLGATLAVEIGAWDARPLRRDEHWLLRVPYSINLGWLTLASFLSTSLFLQNQVGWNGAPLDPEVWGTILVIAAPILALAFLLWRRNFAYALTIVWGLVAIAVGSADRAPWIAANALTAAVLVAGGTGAAWLRRSHLPVRRNRELDQQAPSRLRRR